MTDARYGKRAVHNWANLPPEILRLVVANYLAYKPHIYPPSAWLQPEFHYQRNVYECLRDAYDLQRLMRVCPQWYRALINLDFWVAACRKLDRQDTLGRSILTREAQAAALAGSANANANANLRLVRDYHHFHFLSQACCIPCRINRPYSKDGVGSVKTTLATAPFGQVPVCKAHRNNSFCGVCLKDVTLASISDEAQLGKLPESLFENEDFETWPTVHTTCFHCRRDALLRTVVMYSNPALNLFDFIGGPNLDTKDYEARSTVDSFVDMAEGGVNDVINVLLERHWLRANTNLGSLLEQAVASVRYTRAEFEEYESEDEMISDDDEESYDMLQSHEESGVRTLAVTAWARARILDGNWVTPGDIWCVATGQVPADCPWNPSLIPPTVHPVPYSLITSPSNASASLSNSEIEDAMSTEPMSPQQSMHYPAPDQHAPLPSFRFAQLTSNCFRTTFREILLDPMRHIVCRLLVEAQGAHQDPCVRLAKLGMDDILTMLRDERTWYVDSGNGARLMHAIPYVPASTENMAPMTRSLLEGVWREACAPLFQCQCSICDRALRNQGQGQGDRFNVAQPSGIQAALQPTPTVVPSQVPQQRQIILVESNPTMVNDSVQNIQHPSPLNHILDSDAGSPRSRKRGSAELDDPEVLEAILHEEVSPLNTPRKRQRTGEKVEHGDEDATMSSEPDSSADVDSGGGTGPASPANSTGVPSETGLSSSSASDSSSLRSIASNTPLSALAMHSKGRIVVTDFKTAGTRPDSIKVHGYDEETLYDDAEDGVLYLP
ncbi:hypothetical protein K439DRAFT_1628723 [Ramaria rubella]|nr:hypothetical protein K439DRAFT_1628723 [Ramaria rubella]